MKLLFIPKDEELRIIRNIKILYPKKSNDKSKITFNDFNNNLVFSINLKTHKLSNQLIGMIFERVVGISFERENFQIQYLGIDNYNKPGGDLGIDLICKKKDNPNFYIQCKYLDKGTLGPQRIENILYKAGNYINKYEKNKSNFILVSNKNITLEKNKQRFLKWNELQSKIILEFKVIDF